MRPTQPLRAARLGPAKTDCEKKKLEIFPSSRLVGDHPPEGTRTTRACSSRRAVMASRTESARRHISTLSTRSWSEAARIEVEAILDTQGEEGLYMGIRDAFLRRRVAKVAKKGRE